jgi:adenosylhomocysteine nucleosidase
MGKVILVSASPFERYNEEEINGVPIYAIGVGKVNAAQRLTKIILEEEPDMIVNFGSCGNLKDYKIGDVLKVGTVINDFETYGLTNEEREIVIDENSDIKLFTTDHFYQPFENYSSWFNQNINKCDLVDMEGFALAKVCKDFDIPFHSFKWVSDDGNPDHWMENAAIGYKNFKNEFLQFFFGEY